MQTDRARKKTGREKLTRIIDTCKAVEERSLDPFLVDITEHISTVRELFPEWTAVDDICLDAETLHRVASVIKLQGDWVKHRSTSLYTDPFLLKEKLTRLPKEEIVKSFAQAWHPIVELEQITLNSLMEATRYWESLLPMNERWQEEILPEISIGIASREELMQQRILEEKAFSEELESFWQALKQRVQSDGKDGKIPYWDLVGAETYEETAQRAFMTSFLITYGYATLEIHTLEEEIFVKPNEKPQTKLGQKQLVSIPIAVSVE